MRLVLSVFGYELELALTLHGRRVIRLEVPVPSYPRSENAARFVSMEFHRPKPVGKEPA